MGDSKGQLSNLPWDFYKEKFMGGGGLVLYIVVLLEAMSYSWKYVY